MFTNSQVEHKVKMLEAQIQIIFDENRLEKPFDKTGPTTQERLENAYKNIVLAAEQLNITLSAK